MNEFGWSGVGIVQKESYRLCGDGRQLSGHLFKVKLYTWWHERRHQTKTILIETP
jgi:hypothetical protein